LCGSPQQSLQVILHELGHFADCQNNGNGYTNEFDGC